MMQLLSNEQAIVKANDDKLVLTNQRIHMNTRQWGKPYRITFFLEDISSVEDRHESLPFLLIFSIFSALVGVLILVNDSAYPETSLGAFIVGAVLLVCWLLSRRRVVSISAHGGRSMNFFVTHILPDQLEHLLHQLQVAKSNRMASLRQP